MFDLKVYEKGQVVLPLILREKLHLRKGTKARAFEYDGVVYLLGPPSKKAYQKAIGILPKFPSLSKELLKTKKREFL